MRERLRRIIFESDTRAGRAFDLALIGAILVSLVVVVLDSMEGVKIRHGSVLAWAEWILTGLFTLEYLARLYDEQKGRPVYVLRGKNGRGRDE